MVMQLADGSTQPSGATTPGSWIEEDVGAALSTERALLLVYHPFKADQGLLPSKPQKPAWSRASVNYTTTTTTSARAWAVAGL
ncbi:hypothetical protein PAL_GLEAN10002414 [Pteropus alecto]|uniref:Uncharacterized protein n=1 Tax=Pteropus alecto TaxID=9402 RepID=L5L272_PTEAL|nr:hypothetical protein PAL_GLEAN10002414 [Pteropus alecto]